MDVKYFNHIRDVLKNPKKRAAHDAYIAGLSKKGNKTFNDRVRGTINKEKIDSLLQTIRVQNEKIKMREDDISTLKEKIKEYEDKEMARASAPIKNQETDTIQQEGEKAEPGSQTQDGETQDGEKSKQDDGLGCVTALGILNIVGSPLYFFADRLFGIESSLLVYATKALGVFSLVGGAILLYTMARPNKK